MSKHTPGPWSVQPFGVVKLIQTLDYKTIAKVSAENMPDAKLIAAAPALLAALEALHALIDFDQEVAHGDSGFADATAINAAYAQARAAIRSATDE